MNYEESVAYIHATAWLGSRPGLARITRLCEMLGNPQERLRCIHVAGTNGKGSFCAMLHSILKNAGYRTGLYVSPYIRNFNERFQINGPIENDALAAIMTEIRPFADAMTDDPPTEFELITAAAFLWFARSGCDYVVLETGMGGRLDSTNVIREPVLSVITGIDLDHTAYLGDTPEKVAAEKAGIIKAGRPCVVGACRGEGARVIAEAAGRLSAPLSAVRYDALSDVRTSLDGTDFSFDGAPYRVSLCGAYQARNGAAVLTAVEALRKIGIAIPEDAVRAGLAATVWPGRFEVLSRDPVIVYDGGHNPQGVTACVESVRRIFGEEQVLVLTGVMADKDVREMAELLAPIAKKVFTVTPDNPRAMSADALCEVYRAAGVSVEPFASVKAGVFAAAEESRRSGVPLLAVGSLYMYGEVADAVDAWRGKNE